MDIIGAMIFLGASYIIMKIVIEFSMGNYRYVLTLWNGAIKVWNALAPFVTKIGEIIGKALEALSTFFTSEKT